jgi:hypothetical protein
MERQQQELAVLLTREDHQALATLATTRLWRVLRYLVGRLCSSEESEKWRAVRALGFLASDPERVPRAQVMKLLNRFVWAFNDESGAVPLGIAEGMAEVLAVRPELQERYVPILGSCLTSDDMFQTGPIERGVLWGLGRLGSAAALHAPDAVQAVRSAASDHPESETRRVAQEALRAIEP